MENDMKIACIAQMAATLAQGHDIPVELDGVETYAKGAILIFTAVEHALSEE